LRWPGTRRLLIQETSIIIFGGAYNVEPTVILPKTATSYTFTGLYPGNYYTFGIYTKNASGNASTQVILSNVRTFSDTTPANPNDDTPPNTPTFVSAYGFGDRSTEMQIQWAQSSDDFDAQSNIRYDVYVNGVLENVRFGHRLRSIRRKHDRSLRLGYFRQ
jgi:hypothetical protein